MKKIYKVEFMAELSEEDVRAMKKYFYDTMNESMNIYDLCDLKITPVDEPDNQSKFETVADVYQALENCKSAKEVLMTTMSVPAELGTFKVSFDDEYHGFITSHTFETENGPKTETYFINYAEGWVFNDEDEEV